MCEASVRRATDTMALASDLLLPDAPPLKHHILCVPTRARRKDVSAEITGDEWVMGSGGCMSECTTTKTLCGEHRRGCNDEIYM